MTDAEITPNDRETTSENDTPMTGRPDKPRLGTLVYRYLRDTPLRRLAPLATPRPSTAVMAITLGVLVAFFPVEEFDAALGEKPQAPPTVTVTETPTPSPKPPPTTQAPPPQPSVQVPTENDYEAPTQPSWTGQQGTEWSQTDPPTWSQTQQPYSQPPPVQRPQPEPQTSQTKPESQNQPQSQPAQPQNQPQNRPFPGQELFDLFGVRPPAP